MSINKISRAARFGQFAASFGLLIYVLIFGSLIWDTWLDQGYLGRQLIDGTPWVNIVAPLSFAQAWTSLPLWMLTDVVGIALLWQARSLFLGVRLQGVFVDQTAKRLSMLGWIVVALAPANILTITGVSYLMSRLNPDKDVQVMFMFEETDIYAVVVGLVIVVLGRIMTEAIRLYRENGEFV